MANDTDSDRIAKLIQGMPPITLPKGLAEALEKLQTPSLAAHEFASLHSEAAERLAGQLQAVCAIPPEVQARMDELFRSMEQTQREIASAANFARARFERYLAFEPIEVPHFEFPALPELRLPELPEIDWTATIQSMKCGVVRMADNGWTAPSWMIPREAGELGEVSDSEIDDYFLRNYLGDGPNEGQLKRTSERLLNSAGMEKWRDLLEEVFDCMGKGKHKVCVPSLVSVLEGFIAECLYKEVKSSRRDLSVSVALKRTKWHESGDFTGLFWASAVVFLDHLFAHADFESPRPTFINRHWILHGRSATDWTATDALKLVNALATLHWLFE
jgi:hypothetical protein